MSRAVGLVLVALLTVLAGCSGLGGPAVTETPAVTERTTTADGTTRTTDATTPTSEPTTTERPDHPSHRVVVESAFATGDPVTVQMTVQPDTNETVVNRSVQLMPGEEVDLTAMLSWDVTYSVTVSVPDGGAWSSVVYPNGGVTVLVGSDGSLRVRKTEV